MQAPRVILVCSQEFQLKLWAKPPVTMQRSLSQYRTSEDCVFPIGNLVL